MRASEFIEKLTELTKVYGDLQVVLTEDPVAGCRPDVVFQNTAFPASRQPFFEIR